MGTFLSPKASVEIPAAAVVALKALVFGAATVVVDTALLYALRL